VGGQTSLDWVIGDWAIGFCDWPFMTEIAHSPIAQSPMVWEDFIDIFYAPAQVFARRERGSVWIPLVVVTLLTGVLFYLNSGLLQPIVDAEFERAMATAMRDNPNIPPEAVERMRGFATRIGQVAVFVFMPLGILGVGLVMWLAGKLVDATQSFRAALVVAAYAFTPRVLEGVINSIQGLFVDPSQLDGRFRISFGIGRFLDPDTTSPLVVAVLGRVDVFTLWITVLIAIGLSVTGRIPRMRAAIAAAIVWLAGGLPLIFQALRAM
jgi:hypothetical protein